MAKSALIMFVLMVALAVVVAGNPTTILPQSTTNSVAKTVTGSPWTRETCKAKVLSPSPSETHQPQFPDSVVELGWDDGSWEEYWWVQSPSGPDDYFAVEFDPPAAPYVILHGSVYGTQDGTPCFAECMVCPGTASAPDIGNPYGVIPGEPCMPTYPTFDWVVVDFADTLIDNTGPLWLVVHWPDNSYYGPYVGGDNTSPDAHSYWSNTGTSWNSWTATDWMMRVTIDILEQVEEVAGSPSMSETHSLSQNNPNPFTAVTSVRFSVPGGSGNQQVSLRIYDTSGRLVRTLFDQVLTVDQLPLSTAVSWDRKAENGSPVAAGVYFYRLTARQTDGPWNTRPSTLTVEDPTLRAGKRAGVQAGGFTATKKAIVLR